MTGEFAGRAGNPEDNGTDTKYITAPKTAHRIKRKRCNPPHIGLHHLLYIFTALSAPGISHRAFFVKSIRSLTIDTCFAFTALLFVMISNVGYDDFVSPF